MKIFTEAVGNRPENGNWKGADEPAIALGTPGNPRRTAHGTRRSARGGRRGATVVEFAVVAPLLFLFIFAMIEFGRMVMVEQILTNAAREGARRGILEQSTATEVETIVSDYLTESSISGATVSVSPEHFSQVGFGDPVTVTVFVPYSQVSWLPTSRFLGGTNLSAQSVRRCERPE